MTQHTHESKASRIEADDFARRWSLRKQKLMWFLGAGASASSGVPTAMDMVWDFKQELYVSQQKVSRQAVADLSNPSVRRKLQSHIKTIQNMPEPGATDEYAALFEKVYTSEADRSTYIKALIDGAKPSYGHLALATLMRAGFIRIVWTTNFDRLLDDACASIYETTGSLTTVDLDSPHKAKQVIDDEQWPIEIKLHGDFHSRRLKNTPNELRQQDTHLRKRLVDSCQRYGLVVVGYSGRDDSIMEALYEAVNLSGSYPHGLFWLHRGETPPPPLVCGLLSQAHENGIDAAMVQIENFDEILRDLVRLVKDIDTTKLDEFAKEKQWWSGAPSPRGRKAWPIVRLNALRVSVVPNVCRRVVCEIGRISDVRAAVENAGTNVIATRTHAGVLAFGTDSEVRTTFDSFGITEFDLHTLETKRHEFDSIERSLLRQALTAAIVRQGRLDIVGRRRGTDLLAPANPESDIWRRLKLLVGAIAGRVPNCPELKWREGISIRLDWANDNLWLLIEPRIVFDGMAQELKIAAAAFARARTVKRYNKKLNDLIDIWAQCVMGGGEEIRALGIGDGIDAVYRLSPGTAFSWRSDT